MRRLAWLAVCGAIGAAGAAESLVAYEVAGDAINAPLTAEAGVATRGREVVTGRDANCVLCHAVPEPGVRFMGNLAPPLAGVGARMSAGQLRLRVIDSRRLNRDSIMPSYYRTSGLVQVAETWRGKPILTAQQVEDTVAYLATLR